MKDKKILILIFFISLIIVGLLVGCYYFGMEYYKSKQDYNNIVKEIKEKEKELEKVSTIKDTNIFELGSIKETNASKMSEYEVWEKRNQEIVEKLSK